VEAEDIAEEGMVDVLIVDEGSTRRVVFDQATNFLLKYKN